MALLPPRRPLLLLLALAVHAAAAVQLHFYARSCPRAEAIVRRAVRRRAALDRSVLPALIRLHFHDCFVRVRLLDWSLVHAPTFSSPRSDSDNLMPSVHGLSLYHHGTTTHTRDAISGGAL